MIKPGNFKNVSNGFYWVIAAMQQTAHVLYSLIHFDISLHPVNHHHNQDNEHIYCPQKFLPDFYNQSPLAFSYLTLVKQTTIFIFVTTDYIAFLEFCISEII